MIDTRPAREHQKLAKCAGETKAHGGQMTDISPDVEIRGADQGAWFCREHGFIARTVQTERGYRCAECRRVERWRIAGLSLFLAIACAASMATGSIWVAAVFLAGAGIGHARKAVRWLSMALMAKRLK